MSNARYPLRSFSRGICRSSIGSEETINNPISMMDHAASQVLDGDVHSTVVPVADGIPEEMGGTIHELDDHMSAMENESGRRSPAAVAEVESLDISQGKKAHPRLLGKLIHTDILQETVQSFRVRTMLPQPAIPLCQLAINEAIRMVTDHVFDMGYSPIHSLLPQISISLIFDKDGTLYNQDECF
ncbi:hypothetical protein O6H91_10G099500 [Diphasiastrum complanatum]|uniref:Uncharacterized protein n=1 Tax=Diphasiastrum complanatum TaxID=34168 RepID=A0ACC2CJW0_DIPCM|nr:hypothetical protein O6H91_10G099500 [Diphasiastrum complanatum]